MDQPQPLNLLITLFAGALALSLLAVFVLLNRACPHCHRRRRRGSTVCPYCGTPYGSTTRHSASVSPGPRLILRRGAGAGREYPLSNRVIRIGRMADNDIVVAGTLASRHHATISKQGNQCVLKDCESTNGTYVNDRRIAEHSLRSGDCIQIGETILEFQQTAEVRVRRQEAAPAVSGPPVKLPTPIVQSQSLKTYRIVGMIGDGSTATVYKGVSQKDPAAVVAIKVLNEVDPILQRNFEREARIGAHLRHPHIASILQHGEEGGTYYIIMEYVDGGSLRQRLVPGRASSLDWVRPVVGQTCEALSYAHQHGIIHRDIKPENIMLATKEGVKVVDFGIARLANASAKTSDGIRMGTPQYMSYEQVMGAEQTASSDIYSLGVVLYEMLTGEWPFSGEAKQIIEQIRSETQPKPPRQINPSIPEEIETIVMKAIDRDARCRYQDAMDMARALGYRPGMQFSVSLVNNLRTLPPDWSLHSEGPLPGQLPRPMAGACLIIMTGSMRGKGIALADGERIFARNDIDPNDIGISRQRHFRVVSSAAQYWLEDTGSRNGTFLNGTRVLHRMSLNAGDMIQVGNTLVRFEPSPRP